MAGTRIPDGSRTPAQSEAIALAATLVGELVDPALDGIRELAAERRLESEQRARALGPRLAITPSSASPSRAA